MGKSRGESRFDGNQRGAESETQRLQVEVLQATDVVEWLEGQDTQLWRKVAGGNNDNAMSSANTVALKMNSSSRNARQQGNRARSHPIPPYTCLNGHGTPCSQSSRTQTRTPYPPPADRAWGHSGRGHDPANLQSWRALHHEPKYLSIRRGQTPNEP